MEKNNEKISLSWKLSSKDNNNREYFGILKNYKNYGFATMTKLVAAALKEYSLNHPIKIDSSETDSYKSIMELPASYYKE